MGGMRVKTLKKQLQSIERKEKIMQGISLYLKPIVELPCVLLHCDAGHHDHDEDHQRDPRDGHLETCVHTPRSKC